MTGGKKKRLSMLDSLAAAKPPAPLETKALTPSMMSSNRALRSARDAVDGHNVWELNPDLVDDTRIADRLDPTDVIDLRDAIETNGQTVPILVRRHPATEGRYLLVYGRRRLEAIRRSDKVETVRALVANLDDRDAMQAQISENMARRDLSFIEKALFARELIDTGFGTQTQVAEVLTVTKSSISMALGIVDVIGTDLAIAIGAAHGIGRPRWEALSKAIEAAQPDRKRLIRLAEEVHTQCQIAPFLDDPVPPVADASVAAFDAVARKLEKAAKRPKTSADRTTHRALRLGGKRAGSMRKSAKGLHLEINDGPFADWLEQEAEQALQELHARWKTRAED